MTDRSKFEQMLEYLINEQQDKAKELFHDIVVEKSREIYENLLAEDFEDSELGEAHDDEDMDENMDMEENDMDMGEAHDDEEGHDEMGGDAGDDFMSDVEDDGAEHDEEHGEEGLEDRVVDLEDALDELKAEFEQLMAGEEGEEHMGDDDMGGMDMGMGDEEGHEQPEEESYSFEDMESEEFEEGLMREYVEKVGSGNTYNTFGKMGDDGQNTKSIVAGKNDMGGTSANIAKSFSTEKGGTQGGLLNPSTKPQDGGNVNTPGSKTATKLKPVTKGHGAEKKGAGDTAPDKKSLIGSRK
jgi:hypothetical protein